MLRALRRRGRAEECASTSLLDGRDVPETSALDLRRRRSRRCSPSSTQATAATTASPRAAAACSSRWTATRPTGRMVERGWQHCTCAARAAASRARARRSRRCAPRPGAIDQDLPGFVIADDDGTRSGRSATAPRSSSSTSAATARSRSRAPSRTTSFPARFDRGERPDVALRRHDAVRRRPAAADALPRRARPRSIARSASISRDNGRAPARDQRDAEVRTRDLFLERQPHRHVRRGATRSTSRSRVIRCPSRAPLDEGRRDHRRHTSTSCAPAGAIAMRASTTPTATWSATPADLDAAVIAVEVGRPLASLG